MMIEQEEKEKSLTQLEALQKVVPFSPFATSYSRGWRGLQAVRYRKSPVHGEFEYSVSSHLLGLTIRESEKLYLRYEGVKRDKRLPAGSIAVVPAGSTVLWRRQGSMDFLFISLEPSL